MKTTRRVMSVVLAIAMILTTFGMVTVSAAAYSDTAGHWAESYINVWSDYGVIQGDGGYFRPDDAITRAEVAQVTQNVIGYEDAANNGFIDVPAGAWYEDAILKLAAAGTLTGNGDGTMSPDNYMTREEAMTMLARAYGLTVENSQAGITQYADYQTVSDYATGYVGAMTAAGYVGGYEDGTIRPQANISRAEFVKILDNMIKLYITAPGTYGPGYYGGIAMVKVGGVTLNGVVGNGAVISPQVSGEVSLQNCQFTGNTVNLSKNANVTSNTGINTAVQTSVPNTYYGNGPYSGGIGSFGGGFSSGSGSVTVTFYYFDDFSEYKRVSVTKGGKLNSSKVPDPTAEGDDNWNGAWYKSQAAAEKGMGTEFDPTRQAVTANTVLYAGRAGKVPAPTDLPVVTVDPTKPTQTPIIATAPPATATPKPTNPPEAAEAIVWDITEMFVKADESLDTDRFPVGTTNGRYKVTNSSIKNYNGLTFVTSAEMDNAIQGSTNTFDDGYTSTWSLKTGGKGSDTDKIFKFTPATSGKLKIYATSGSGSSDAPVTVKQDGKTLGTATFKPKTYEVYTLEGVEAGKEVTLVAGGNVQYYRLVFVPDSSVEPVVPTTPPGKTISWDITEMFVNADESLNTDRFPQSTTNTSRYNVTPTSIVNINGLTFITASEINEAIQKSAKTFDDGFKTTWSMKTQGAGTDDDKIFVFTPEKPGTLKVYATSGSSSSNALLTVKQDGVTVGSNEFKPATFEVYELSGIAAGKEVKLVAGGNVQYFNIVFEESNVPAPTDAPIATATIAPSKDSYKATLNVTGGTGVLEGEGLVSAQSDEVNAIVEVQADDTLTEDGIFKVTTDVDDNTVYTLGDDQQLADLNGYGDKNSIYLYRANITGNSWKIEGTGATLLIRNSSIGDTEADLTGVIAVKVPYNSKLSVTAGGNSNHSAFAMKAQTGLGADAAANAKTVVSVPEGRNMSASSTEEEYYEAKAGDIVYIYPETDLPYKFSSVTFIPSEIVSASEKWVAIDHRDEFAGAYNPDPVKIGDLTMTMVSDTYNINVDPESIEADYFVNGVNTGTITAGIEALQGSTNTIISDTSIAPENGSVFKFSATQKGTVKLSTWFHGKGSCIFTIVKFAAGETANGTEVFTKLDHGTYSFFDKDFEIEPGYDYYVYNNGSKLGIRSVEFVPEGAEPVKPTAEPTATPNAEPTEEPLPDNVYKFIEGSTVTVKTQPDADKANYVAEITVTGADGTKINVSGTTFVMPSQDVTVDVVYKEPAQEATATPSAKPTDEPTQTAEPTVLPAAKTVLYVDGSKDTDAANNQFKTVREAVAKAAEINPQSNEDRVEIQIMPGLYREQIVLKTPYVTFRKAEAATEKKIQATWGESSTNVTGTYQPDPTKEVVLTWYYGIGSAYKSIGADGFYDPNAAATSTEATEDPEKWGATVYATSAAKEFVAYDIVFENSYNRYVTDEEIADGVKSIDGKPARTKDSDVASNTYNERSAALYTDSDKAQFLNCKMLSSQDTFGANSRLYVKDCYIEGRTDYICGKASAIFDNCQLMFYGYSNSKDSGTITAMQEPVIPGYGVLFNECYIGNTKSSTANGSLGRPWRQSAQVTYYNCIFEKNTSLISASGWGGMGDATAEAANFGEYGSKYTDGTPVDLSGRTAKYKTVKTDWSILEYNGRNYLNNGDNWDPMGVADLYANVDKVMSETTVVIPEGTSTKVDLPAAPDGYEFKWESNSEYATVNNDGTLTVVRPANGEAPIETTIVLYTREADNKSIGDKKIIPVTIAPTTDTENVFTMSGTVALTQAADKNIDVVIKAYQGTAVIKTQNVTIEAGQTSVQYTAANIPVDSYDVLADCVTEGYRVLIPDSGKATVSGVKGGTNTLDVTVAKLVEVSTAVTTDPTAIGSGVTVTNNDGSYHVASTAGVTGGAYWNLVDLAAELETTETVTLSYRLTISDVFTNKDGANGASIDLLTNTPGTFASSENKARVIRTLFGRWDQVNMLDAQQASISGSSNNEHMWLNCSGDKFDSKATFPISYDLSITVDFKTNSISATAQTVGNEKVSSYAFEGFPTEINRDKLSLAFYTGSKAQAEYDVSNISVTYTKFE